MTTECAPPRGVHGPEQNHLLGALRKNTVARLYPHLKFVHLQTGEVIYEPDVVMQRVYFPTDSVISLLHVLQDGASSEISVIGNEGLIGVPIFMGADSTPNRVVVQRAGGAYHLPGQILKNEFDKHGELTDLLLNYTQALITQMAQTVVCNRHHKLDQQLCRWLLMSLDRVTGNRLLITQEWIASMLGVRREGVTEAAVKLQKLGVITYKRGKIEVLDRGRLEALCCECYAVVKMETERLLSYLPANRQVQ